MHRRRTSVWDARSLKVYGRLLGYTRRYWPVVVVAMLGMVIDGSGLAAFTKLLKPMIDRLFAQQDPYLIFWMPIWIVAIFVVRGVGTFASTYGVSYVGRHVVQAMQRDVFSAYLRLSPEFFGTEPSGQQISRITYTSEQVATASSDALKVGITESVTVIGMLYVMLSTSAYLTLVLLLMVPPVAVIATVVSRRYQQISRRIQGSMGSVTGTVEEVVRAYREVRIYGGQTHESARFHEVTDRTRGLNVKIAATNALSSSAIQTVSALALAALVFLGTLPGVINHISSGVFVTVLTAMGAMIPSLKRLTNVQANIQRGVSAAQDLFEVIDKTPEPDHGRKVLARARGELCLEKVSFRYPGSRQAVLHNICLHCPPGSVTALVGRSGSGKSSLVALLPRFYVPDSGCITLDGEDYQHYTLASLRRQIAWVGQNVVLFDGTVAENIAYGELAGASEQAIMAAAEAANAMEFIAHLPHGIHSAIGESGSKLSGGQRQRIAIARAILKDASILVLDEATSALDSELERLIQQALKRLMENRTTLVIAHRLSTIEHADQIVVMDRGFLVEHGSHGQLMAMNGYYAMLHRMQFNPPSSGTDLAKGAVHGAG